MKWCQYSPPQTQERERPTGSCLEIRSLGTSQSRGDEGTLGGRKHINWSRGRFLERVKFGRPPRAIDIVSHIDSSLTESRLAEWNPWRLHTHRLNTKVNEKVLNLHPFSSTRFGRNLGNTLALPFSWYEKQAEHFKFILQVTPNVSECLSVIVCAFWEAMWSQVGF